LETASTFSFVSETGRFTARREQSGQKRGGWYWKAYHKQHGKLSSHYLGKSATLTLARLQDAAQALAAAPAGASPGKAAEAAVPSAHGAADGARRSIHPPLLATKLYRPLPRAHLVRRSHLMERLTEGAQGPLMLLSAPAGFGKTTLLAQWLAERGTRAAWLSLDAGERDPARFLTYLVAAVQTLVLNLGAEVVRLLHSSQPPPIETLLTTLLNDLTAIPDPFVLVLDDYHLVEANPVDQALTYLVEHLPPHLHLVLATREDPQLPLARFRARGQVTELRAADLRFTPSEAADFLTQVMGLPLSAADIVALEARTEGWIAGLQLAALSLQGRNDVAGFIAAFTGSHRYVVDYLVEEVLSRQAADVQDFLVRTCILDRLCGPLCDALCERDDSQAVLAQLERSNLFLVALDEHRQWYRYHHLFAEALRSRLHQIHPALVPELHRRASRWYEQYQLFDEAITHALAVPDSEQAIHLIEHYAWLTNFPSKFQALLGWLNRLPDVLIRAHPILCIMQATTLLIQQQWEQASARIQDAERCLAQELPADQRRTILCLIAASRGNLARFVGDHERGVSLAQQALALMPEVEETPLIRMAHQGTLVTAASTYLVDGEMTAGTERLVRATVAAVRDLGNLPTTLRSISNLARLQLLQGRLCQAARTIEEGRQLASEHEGLPTLLNGIDYYFLQGDLLREWNQLKQAEELLEQGMDLDRGAVTAEAEMISRGYLALARLQQACGQGTQANQTLEAFSHLAHRRGFARTLLAGGAAARAQLALAQGDLAAAIRWVEESSLSTTDELSYPREREFLTLARVRIAQGRVQPMGFFLSDALGLLERLLEDAEPKERRSSVLEILLLRALALQAQGKQAEALGTLERALVCAEPEGFIRLFLDEGAPMLVLLRQASARQITPGYVMTLLKAADQRVGPIPHRSSLLLGAPQAPTSGVYPAGLTAREVEVLRHAVQGLTYAQIAERLIVSVRTVDAHLQSVYRKLGVTSRLEAARFAQAHQLFGEDHR